MENLYVKDMVSSLDAKLYCVGTDWTLNQVVSFLIENDIPACPVTKANTNKGIIRQIEGYAVLKELALKLKEYGESPIVDFMNDSEWEVSDNQYLVDKMSVLYRKPVFSIKNNQNQYYATIFQKDVTWFFYHVSSRFMLIRAIENKLSGFIYSIDDNESIYEVPLGVKIEKLFSDNIWNKSKIGFDKNRLHVILNNCAEIRNQFVHHRDSDVDVKFLKKSWDILKRELQYIPNEDMKSEDLFGQGDFNDYLEENPEIVKDLLKKNPTISKEEATKFAKTIWGNYCEQNKDRDDEREIEHKKRWEEALKWESYNTLFEHADNNGLDD
jgi:hypothetical protein